MEIENIYEFLMIAEYQDLAETSDQLYCSASALSKHLRKLEDSLGHELFTRTARKMKLSAEGELFLPYAQRIVDAYQEYEDASLHISPNSYQYVRIGMVPSIAQNEYEPIVQGFQPKGGIVRTAIQVANENKLLHMFRNNELDFAFIRSSKNPSDEFSYLQYSSSIIAAILPKSHQLAKNNTLTLDLLKDEQFAFLSSDNPEYNLCLDACHSAGFEPQIRLTCRYERSIIDIVSSGTFIALLDKNHIPERVSPNFAVVDITPTISSTMYVLYHPDEDNEACNRYLKHLEQMSQLLSQNSDTSEVLTQKGSV